MTECAIITFFFLARLEDGQFGPKLFGCIKQEENEKKVKWTKLFLSPFFIQHIMF